MAHETLRDVLAVLEQRGRLRRIAKPVDVGWEPACFVKWAFQAVPEPSRFGLWFENVAGHDMPVVTGALGCSTEAYAIALGVEPNDINAAWERALLKPIAPRTVASGICQETVLRDGRARLDRLPIPTWTPGKDIGPYLTTIVVTANAETKRQNMGFYRTRVRDAHSVVANLSPGRQGLLNARTWHDRGKPAPIAWVIGAPPLVTFAASANLPWGADEMEVAGGLQGKPIELVKAKTVDLLVPANAEIVIEGEVHPGEMDTEGPFGEFAGYMGPISQKPVARITAITHRKQPVYYGVASQMPPSESTIVQSLTNAGVLMKLLRHDLGEHTVADAFIDLNFGGLLAHAIVAMSPRYPGHAKKVGRMVADCTPIKRVTMVDPDIDIRDPLHVEWALNARYDPARDTVIIDDVFFPMGMDPSVRIKDGKTEQGSKLVIDATQSIDSGTFSLPPKDLMAKARASWQDAGLPAFDIPKRARLRIDKS